MGGSTDELQLEVALDENVAMAQLGHLRHWAPNTERVRLLVPPAVPKTRVLDSMRLCGNCFPHLSHMHVSVQGAEWVVDQAIIAGAAELLGLRSLSIEGGCMEPHTLQLHVLTSLKGLNSLVISSSAGGGVGDTDICDNLALLTQLTRLELRGDLDNLTDEGVVGLSSLVSLRQLTLMPVGLMVSREGLEGMFRGLPDLHLFKAGFSCSQQVDVLQAVPDRVTSTSVVVSDPGADAPSLLTSCALCLGPALTSLKLHTVKVEDASFLLALGSLTALQQLSLTVAPARQDTPSFMLNLAVLGQLKALQSLEVSVVGTKLLLPFTTKLAGYLVDSWPHLTNLALSCMVPPERLNPSVNTPATAQPAVGRQASGSGLPSSTAASSDPSAVPRLTSLSGSGLPPAQSPGSWRGPLQPAALEALQSFTQLRRLVLVAPLPDEGPDPARDALDQDSSDDDNVVEGAGLPRMRRIPLPLTWLPASLQDLVLERAELQLSQDTTPPAQLSRLTSLALSQCKASDATLTSLFTATPALERLELSEVHGISGAALKSLVNLNKLSHLEVVDTRSKRHMRLSSPAPSVPHDTPSPAPSTSWWGWLTGSSSSSQAEAADSKGAQSRQRASRDGPPAVRPRLQVTDISHLAQLSALRHLIWGVGAPLLIPQELRRPAMPHRGGDNTAAGGEADDDSASDVSSSSDEEEDVVLGLQGAARISAMKAVRGAVSQLQDLHQLYLATDPGSVDALVYQSRLSAALGSGTTSGSTTAQQGAKGSSRAVQAAGSSKAPHWISSALPASCVVVGQLPIAQHDPWTDKPYLTYL